MPAYNLPLNLQKSIVNTAALAFDNAKRFPLQDDKLVYLGESHELEKWLTKYVLLAGQDLEGTQRIIDLRNGDYEIEKGDIVITKDPIEDESISQLVIPIEYEGIEIDICKMLFGGKAITGNHANARIVDNYYNLTYSNPEWEGMNRKFELQIDSLSNHAISNFATPGVQVAVVKNGSLVFEKAYGYFSYDSIQKVDPGTIYDLASVTKVLATLPAIALLVDQGKISLEDSISQHLPAFERSNKSAVTIKQLLAHQGGMRSYIPFWSMMMDGDRLDAFYYKTPEDEALDRRSYGYEPDPILLDTLKNFLVRSDLIKNTEAYNYSDLGYMVLHLIVEAVSGQKFEKFLMSEFYEPMGLSSLGFNPVKRGIFPESITPTEYDERFRNYQVWGEVHDRNAAVFGGAAGHAGLFSNATDLAKMMSMLMNEGVYGGKRYLSKEVLDQFNIRHFSNNRRGLGWDKKDWKRDSASKYASDRSFGHTGFTGTMVWADPMQDLIYVFLSNRIYPDANNWRLSQFNTRTNIHNAIYESIISLN